MALVIIEERGWLFMTNMCLCVASLIVCYYGIARHKKIYFKKIDHKNLSQQKSNEICRIMVQGNRALLWSIVLVGISGLLGKVYGEG
jgi:hypothetical protein